MKQSILTVNIATLVIIALNFLLASVAGHLEWAYPSLVGVPIVLYTTYKSMKETK